MMPIKEKLKNLINSLLNVQAYEENLDTLFLERVRDQVKSNYPTILVTGTNGKGSVCAFISSILKSSGYRVGVFTSPHVIDYNERITIDNVNISDQDFYDYLQKVANDTAYLDRPFGFFRLLTLIAHSYFIDKNIDIAVIEVGIGGAKDITNCFDPDISIITKVALDHCEVLGDNREKIGLEKAKIFRSIKPAIYGEFDIPNSVLDYAQKINTNLLRFGIDFKVQINDRNSWHYLDLKNNVNNLYSLLTPSMRGKQQVVNAAIAICAIQQLEFTDNGFTFSKTVIKNAISMTRLKGRFEVLPGYPRVILDVAHNPDAVANMVHNMLELGLKNNIAVFAVAKDKDIKNIIKNSKKYFKKWYIAPIENIDRSCNLEDIVQELTQQDVLLDDICSFDCVADAMLAALKMRQADYNIVVFGSFLTVAAANHVEFRKI